MADAERRKCKCCHKLFRPDPRNRHHQRYCAAPSCRAASKAASQARWLAAPENQDYFRGPVNVARVKEWRSRHPGYWRKRRCSRVALQELSFERIGKLSALDGDFSKADEGRRRWAKLPVGGESVRQEMKETPILSGFVARVVQLHTLVHTPERPHPMARTQNTEKPNSCRCFLLFL